MKRLLSALFVVLLSSPAFAQRPAAEQQLLEQLVQLGKQAEAILTPPPPAPEPSITVPSGGDLTGALSVGGVIHLTAGGRYEATSFTVKSGTTLYGHGATVHGTSGSALIIEPNTSNVVIENLFATSVNDVVVLLGRNDATVQSTVASVPQNIILRGVTVPTHRGKRAFEVNAAGVQLIDSFAYDVWDPALRDSQAIAVLNTTGNLLVRGGWYEAGSEVVLVGGDILKLEGVVAPRDLFFEGVTFTRPASWQTDGVNRAVKNIFELKTGHNVVVRDSALSNIWSAAQTGFAVMLTPTRGGSLVDVLFERITVTNAGGGFNITAVDSHGISTIRTTGIVVRDSSFTLSKASYGGTGRFVQVGGNVGTFDAERVTVSHDASVFFYGYDGVLDRIRIVDSTFNAGSYGIMVAGGANLSNQAAGVVTLEVTGNTISAAASALKTRIPNNTFVP